MTTLTATLTRDRRLAIVGVAGFVVALAAASQIAIPIPGTPVPITLQPMIVVLAGLMLGPGFGAASMVLYLAFGAAGVPVFAPIGLPGIARFAGPTGGYLMAYPVAAAVAGMLAQRFPTLLGRWIASEARLPLLLNQFAESRKSEFTLLRFAVGEIGKRHQKIFHLFLGDTGLRRHLGDNLGLGHLCHQIPPLGLAVFCDFSPNFSMSATETKTSFRKLE